MDQARVWKENDPPPTLLSTLSHLSLVFPISHFKLIINLQSYLIKPEFVWIFHQSTKTAKVFRTNQSINSRINTTTM